MLKVYALTPDSEEQGAVVVARTSRSPHTFDTILEEVRTKGHVEFIKTNVIGYGHDSVAEGAMCPWIGIEDVSDLAANVVACADPQLRVQMTSTRYQDMAKRRIIAGRPELGEQMKTKYAEGMTRIQKILDDTDHPRKRTLQCDIARAFLPAGISTQVAIRGDARTMRDAINFMQGHALPEVRDVGAGVLAATKEFVEVLLERHMDPAVTPPRECLDFLPIGVGRFKEGEWRFLDRDAEAELVRWRKSGWRRRMRLAAAPFGPYMNGVLSTDYGAYRDLRRNRTIHQDDAFPNPKELPQDSLWAFRDLYPEVCDAIDKLSDWNSQHEKSDSADPYLAPMGSPMVWRAGGHILNWAYMLRLRSGVMCHPGYASPERYLMKQILAMAPWMAEAMGIVESPKSWLGVEFSDRVSA